MTMESIAPASPPRRDRPAAKKATPPTPIPVIPRVEFDYDVAIVGLGYVGLPTALTMHASGARVLGIDDSRARLNEICAGDADLLEFDRIRLAEALLDEQFTVTNDADPLSEAAAIVICVPTPIDEHLTPDLDILRAACATVVDHAVAGQLILLTSTTYAGCTRDLLVAPLKNCGLTAGRDIHVAFSPERIDPGNDRFTHEDVPRVVGGATPSCLECGRGTDRSLRRTPCTRSPRSKQPR